MLSQKNFVVIEAHLTVAYLQYEKLESQKITHPSVHACISTQQHIAVAVSYPTATEFGSTFGQTTSGSCTVRNINMKNPPLPPSQSSKSGSEMFPWIRIQFQSQI